jgi:3-dehydroquinate dehydratase II
MKKILVLHGPNLNLLGTREPEFYGTKTMTEIDAELVKLGKELGIEVVCRQSNHEGVLIDALQEAAGWAAGVIFNPGGFTNTSIALRDTVTAIGIPVVEVHLSNIAARDEFRRLSMIAPACVGSISGFGWRSYVLALQFFRE